MLKEASYDSIDKLTIERSQTYLGYKILWIINLFLDGRKFPSGRIREGMWRAYIHDILEFLSSTEYLKTLLYIDPESVFQIISVIFYPSKKVEGEEFKNGPFELVSMGREEEEGGPEPAHWRFMRVLDDFCIKKETAENVRFQYFYFVAKIVSRSPAFRGFDPRRFFDVAIQLLQNHKRYIEFVKRLYEMSSNAKRIQKGEDPSQFILLQGSMQERKRDMDRCSKKVENDIIHLLKMSEPLDTLQMNDVNKYVDNTNFNRVKTEVLEKREEYVKSLQMLFQSQQSNEAKMAWIEEKIVLLEEKAARTGQVFDKNVYEGFKREIITNFKVVISINVKLAIELVEKRLGANHPAIIDQLQRDSLEQLLYLDALLDNPNNQIQETIRGHYTGQSSPEEVKKCIGLLKQHVRVCCINRPQSVVTLVKQRVLQKNSCYPLEECHAICQEYKQAEAVFLLSKKLGRYFDSIKIGVGILRTGINYRELKVEVFYCRESEISTKFVMPKSKKAEMAETEKEKAEREKLAAEEAAQSVKVKALKVPLLAKNGMLVNQNEVQEEIAHAAALEKQHETQIIPPNIAYYDQIFGRLLKICLNYSKEVDQKHEDAMWFIVVDSLFETLRPLSLEKTYGKAFFDQRFYAFIEALVKVHRNGFSKLIDHLVKP